jgi:hypothetical protein
MFTECIVYLYYLYRTYIVPYYYYLIYKLYNDYKKYDIVVVSQDKKRCDLLSLNEHTYTFLNSKIFTSFIIITHNVYINEQYSTYYEIICEKLDRYEDFMNKYQYKPIDISTCKFIGAEIKDNNKSFIIPIEKFLVVSNQLFFKEFNMWLLQYYFKDKYINPNIILIDENINMINLVENESLTILENDYVKTI